MDERRLVKRIAKVELNVLSLSEFYRVVPYGAMRQLP